MWCPECGSKAEVVTSTVIGYTTHISYRCFGPFKHSGNWKSSPTSGKLHHLKILVSTAASLCGIGSTSLTCLFKTLKMPTMSNSSFRDHETKWLFPTVYQMFINMRDRSVDSIRDKVDLVLSGDGQFDSPGHCAKYCVYTLMDHCTYCLSLFT